MKQLRQFSFGLAAILTLFSCNKKDDNNSNPNPPVATLTGTWKITAMTSDKDVPAIISGTMTRDIWKEVPDCIKDNTETYQSDGSVVYDEGATKCDAADPQKKTGSYAYSHPALTVNGYQLTVLQLDATTLKYSQSTYYYYYNSNQQYDSLAIVATLTLQRQ